MDPKTSQPAKGNASAPAAAAASTQETKPAPETVVTAGFIPNMDEVLSSSKSRTSGGTKIRANIGYTLVGDGVKKLIGTSIPDQQKVLLSIMNSALTKEKPVISEPELHKLVVAAHAVGRLKTKQDPWHIFRYYRTSLKSAGALREVVIAGELETKAA
jgi:hypothetical protein